MNREGITLHHLGVARFDTAVVVVAGAVVTVVVAVAVGWSERHDIVEGPGYDTYMAVQILWEVVAPLHVVVQAVVLVART